MSLEGIVSKRADAPYAPGNRGLWVKVKCLHREEFVVVGWTDPEGSRPWLGALLIAYYDPEGRLVYAGRAGTCIKQAELERLWRRLQPLALDKMPLEVPPPRTTRFGSPLGGIRRHWGLKIGAHALRAAAATNALDHQADIAKVQEWLGHANIATTLPPVFTITGRRARKTVRHLRSTTDYWEGTVCRIASFPRDRGRYQKGLWWCRLENRRG